MINWLGQDIEAGDIVYRGARERDGSSFRIGRVQRLNDGARSATILWLLEQSVDWENKTYMNVPKLMKSRRYRNGVSYSAALVSTCSVDTLFKVNDTLDIVKLIEIADDGLAKLTAN